MSVVLDPNPVRDPDPQEIATAAYLAWQQDGCPDGRDVHYWHEAEERLRKGLSPSAQSTGPRTERGAT